VLQGCANPPFQAPGFGLRSHRADKGLLGLGITHFEAARRLHQTTAEGRILLLVNQDLLYANAALARLIKGTEDGAIDGVGDVGV